MPPHLPLLIGLGTTVMILTLPLPPARGISGDIVGTVEEACPTDSRTETFAAELLDTTDPPSRAGMQCTARLCEDWTHHGS